MKIVSLRNVRKELRSHAIRYHYRFREYEVHLNVLWPGATTDWHHHERIWETVFVIQGFLTVKWRVGSHIKEQIVGVGDVVEVERTSQSFVNHTDQIAEFLDIKQVLSGQDKRKILLRDKVSDE